MLELFSGALVTRHDVLGILRMIENSPIRNGDFHRTTRCCEIKNQAQLVILQCSDRVVARRDLCRGCDGVRVFATQLGYRYREIADQRRVNQIAKINNAAYAVSVD